MKQKVPYFYKLEEDEEIDGFEIHPVRTTKDGSFTIDEEQFDKKRDMWSVYAHHTQGGVRCLADLATKKEAKQLVTLLESMYLRIMTSKLQNHE